MGSVVTEAQPGRDRMVHRAASSAVREGLQSFVQSLPAAPFSCSTAASISCGSSQSSSPSCPLSGGEYVDFWTFHASAGQSVTLSASSSSASQILLTVQRSSDGSIAASNYAAHSVSLNYTFPSTDTYFIGVGYVTSFVTTTYTLSVTCGSTSGKCSFAGSLSIGGSVSGQLTSADSACGDSTSYAKAYSLIVVAGETFSVKYSATYPVYLTIYGPDDSGAWRASTGTSVTSDYIAPATGEVTLWAYSNTTAPVTGSFSLSVARLNDPCRHRAVRH